MCLVDLPTGRLGLTEHDWELRLPLPLQQVRTYRSDNVWQGDLGYGWGHTWGMRFWAEQGNSAFLRLADGRRAPVELPARGAVAANSVEQVTVTCLGIDDVPWADIRRGADRVCYLVQVPDTPTLVFSDRTLPQVGFLWLGLADRAGNWAHWVLDQAGRPERLITPWQRAVRFVRTPEGLLQEIWLEAPGNAHPGTRLIQYSYDAQGDLVGIVDPAGERRYRYHEHLLIQHVDRIGGTCTSDFDAQRRCVLTSGPQGTGRRQYAYDPQARKTQVTDSQGHTTTYRSNQQDLVVEVEDPLGRQSLFEYDQAYRVIKATNQLGAMTQFVYGPNGALLTKISPLGNPDCLETDRNGLLVRRLSPSGVPTFVASRDPLGRIISLYQPSQGTTEFAWAPDGTLSSRTSALGETTRIEWDAAHQVYTESVGQRVQLRRQFDAQGHLVQLTDAEGRITKLTYDPAGHLQTVTQPDGTSEQFRFDAEGQLLQVTNPVGTKVEYHHNAAHRVTSKRVAGIQVAQAEYDSENRLIRAAGEDGLFYEFTYDALGRLAAQRFPDGRHEKYDHDARGNLVQFTDPQGDLVTSTYDAADKLSTVTYPDGARKVITRDVDSRWTQVALIPAGTTRGSNIASGKPTDAPPSSSPGPAAEAGARTVESGTYHVVCTREFDELGRPIVQTCNGFFHRSAYNDANQVAEVIGSDGRRVEFTYGDQGRVTAVTVARGRWRDELWQLKSVDRCHTLAYSETGQITEWKMPGDKQELRTYDACDRLTAQLILSGKRQILSRTYQYDPLGRLVEVTDSLRGTTRYQYDARDRLIGVQSPSGTEQYNYDQRGDRTASTIQFAAGHRVLRWGSRENKYDARGFVVQRRQPQGNESFNYTYQGLLISYQPIMGTPISYHYDGLSRLIRKTKGSQSMHYHWYENQLWSIETSGAGLIEFTFLPGSFTPLEQVVAGRALTVHTDHRGRVMELIDEAGQIVWQNTHDVWGAGRTVSDDGLSSLFEYPGQLWDADLGMYYHRYRIYDPLTAHFLTPDPIGTWGGLNAYTYPLDPVNSIDPLGLACTGRGNEPTLYRGDSRPPSQICQQGFVPQDPSQTALQHMNGGCGWVSTAFEGSTAEKFAEMAADKHGGEPYVYVIANPGCGLEVECDPEVQQWQQDVGSGDDDTEHEVAFNKAIPPGNIVGYYDIRVGGHGFQAC